MNGFFTATSDLYFGNDMWQRGGHFYKFVAMNFKALISFNLRNTLLT